MVRLPGGKGIARALGGFPGRSERWLAQRPPAAPVTARFARSRLPGLGVCTGGRVVSRPRPIPAQVRRDAAASGSSSTRPGDPRRGFLSWFTSGAGRAALPLPGMLLQATLNGPLSKSDHPAVPVTPGELAGDAVACVAAGARRFICTRVTRLAMSGWTPRRLTLS